MDSIPFVDAAIVTAKQYRSGGPVKKAIEWVLSLSSGGFVFCSPVAFFVYIFMLTRMFVGVVILMYSPLFRKARQIGRENAAAIRRHAAAAAASAPAAAAHAAAPRPASRPVSRFVIVTDLVFFATFQICSTL